MAFAFDDLRISAHCGADSHEAWLREFLEPDFQFVDGPGDCAVHVVGDAKLYLEALGSGPTEDAALLDCFALDSSVVRLPVLQRKGSATTVYDAHFEAVYAIEPDDRRVVIVAREENHRVRASLLRVVREFAMNHLLARGLFLHASAIAIGDVGIAFSGHKAAGKTTMLTYLLSQRAGQYLSNDRVFVADAEDRPVLRNIPTVISVRPGTLELCADFRDRFLGSGFTSYLETLAESVAVAKDPIRPNQFGNYFLSPAQYRTLLGAKQEPRATASALVFPVISDDLEFFNLRELSTQEALDRVPDAILGSGGWRKGTDAFTIPGTVSAPDESVILARAERFCRAVRCFEVRLGRRAYEDGSLASEIRSLVESVE